MHVTSSGVKTPDIGGRSKTQDVTRAISEEIMKQKNGADSDMGIMKENVLLKW